MGLNVRKLAVGSVALAVLAGVFLLYLRFNRTPPIVVEADRPAPVAEANEPNVHDALGTIAGVDVGGVQEAEFQHRDETGRIDRRFGFHELIQVQGDQREVTKPYMEQFLPEAVCRVTADRGRVRLDDTFGRPMPTDASFFGNVVIHLTPTDPDNPWECFIHLDDVGFLAEKSLCSSTGAVRFLSRAVRLTGTGMEMVYNTGDSRIELFRVFDLYSLRWRSSELKAMFQARSSDSQRRVAGGSAVSEDSNGVSVAAEAEQAATSADSNAPPVDVYRCVFRENVRLRSPYGVGLAKDVLAIDNIQWSQSRKRAPARRQAVDPNTPRSAAGPVVNALDTTASSHIAINAIPEELYDTVVTCDGGVAVTLTNGPHRVAESVASDADDNSLAKSAPEEIASSEPNQVIARRIDYDYSTSDATILGPFAGKLLIDPNRLGEKAGGTPMPAVVTAKKMVRYLAASRKIVLEGDCIATLHKSDPNADDEHRLTAPRLTMDVVIDSNVPGDVRLDVRRFVADAGEAPAISNDPLAAPPVAVRMWRRVSGKLLGWGALDTRELQYDADPGRFTALGPGIVWLHNEATIRSKEDPNEMTLEPCYVRMSNFDTMEYGSLSNRIVADDDAQQLRIDYFPLVEGRYGPQTQVVAGHIEATLQRVAEGRMDLVSLVASQGIEYDSEADHRNFVGSELVYDRAADLMTIRGDDTRPCNMNGVFVDQIVVNPKTGEIEAKPLTSIFPVGP